MLNLDVDLLELSPSVRTYSTCTYINYFKMSSKRAQIFEIAK
uniref:Uncharacterized protein n=1 Tax=Anguilla anguilla TaxID=7936 RepID=A0A0E9RH56_ANGAN